MQKKITNLENHKCKDQHEKVISLIKAIAQSFPDAPIIYQFGACYSFYKILKSVFPEAEAYETKDNNHIVTKIGGRFYDVKGEKFWNDGTKKTEHDFQRIRSHEYWESVVIDRRVEYMISLYNKP